MQGTPVFTTPAALLKFTRSTFSAVTSGSKYALRQNRVAVCRSAEMEQCTFFPQTNPRSKTPGRIRNPRSASKETPYLDLLPSEAGSPRRPRSSVDTDTYGRQRSKTPNSTRVNDDLNFNEFLERCGGSCCYGRLLGVRLACSLLHCERVQAVRPLRTLGGRNTGPCFAAGPPPFPWHPQTYILHHPSRTLSQYHWRITPSKALAQSSDCRQQGFLMHKAHQMAAIEEAKDFKYKPALAPGTARILQQQAAKNEVRKSRDQGQVWEGRVPHVQPVTYRCLTGHATEE